MYLKSTYKSNKKRYEDFTIKSILYRRCGMCWDLKELKKKNFHIRKRGDIPIFRWTCIKCRNLYRRNKRKFILNSPGLAKEFTEKERKRGKENYRKRGRDIYNKNKQLKKENSKNTWNIKKNTYIINVII